MFWEFRRQTSKPIAYIAEKHSEGLHRYSHKSRKPSIYRLDGENYIRDDKMLSQSVLSSTYALRNVRSKKQKIKPDYLVEVPHKNSGEKLQNKKNHCPSHLSQFYHFFKGNKKTTGDRLVKNNRGVSLKAHLAEHDGGSQASSLLYTLSTLRKCADCIMAFHAEKTVHGNIKLDQFIINEEGAISIEPSHLSTNSIESSHDKHDLSYAKDIIDFGVIIEKVLIQYKETQAYGAIEDKLNKLLNDCKVAPRKPSVTAGLIKAKLLEMVTSRMLYDMLPDEDSDSEDEYMPHGELRL